MTNDLPHVGEDEGLSRLEPITVISMEDDAIDVERTDRDAFFRYLVARDEKHLTFKPGATPIRYTLRPLSRPSLVHWVLNATADEDRWMRALMATLDLVSGHPNYPGGFRPETRTDKRIGTLAEESTIIECVEPAGALLELGKLAYDRAHIPPKARRVCLPPPGSFSRNSERLRAVGMRKQEAERLQAQQRSEQPSGETGNATAAASDSTSPATP